MIESTFPTAVLFEEGRKFIWNLHDSRMVYGFLLALMGCICIAIYRRRGTLVCAMIISYVYALSFMTVLNRNLFMNYHFHFPRWVAANHFLATFTFGSTVLVHRKVMQGKQFTWITRETLIWGIAPVALAVVVTIGCANLGVLYTNVHFYEMMGSMTPVVTTMLSVAFGRKYDSKFTGPLVVMTSGMFFVSRGELNYSVVGAAFITFSLLARSTKSILQGMLLSDDVKVQHLDPVELVFYQSAVCVLLMAAWSLLTEGFEPYAHVWDVGFFNALLATMINASVINISSLYVLKELGPVAQQVVGQMKGVLSCMAGVIMLGEVIVVSQMIGYAVLIAGIAWYNNVDCPRKATSRAALPSDEEKAPLAPKKEDSTV